MDTGSTSEEQQNAETSTARPSSEPPSAQYQRTEIDISETQGVRLGTCKWFNVSKGWGFITPKDGGQDVFVHQSVIKMPGFRSLGEEELVEFECKITKRGLEATRVSGPGSADCAGSTRRRTGNGKRYRRMRCYNCGEFSNHLAAECHLGPQPKRCHNCHSEDHLVVDCPNTRKKSSKDKSDDEDIA